MAYVDDARHSGRNSYAGSVRRMPRQIMLLGALATSIAIWAVMILTVASQF
jgi:hypothetical protein